MKKSVKIVIISAIIMLLVAVFAVFRAGDDDENLQNPDNSTKKHEYFVRLENEKVYLFDNGIAIKEYSINPRVLPGEDYEMLSDGIRVDSIAEADSFAENFDG